MICVRTDNRGRLRFVGEFDSSNISADCEAVILETPEAINLEQGGSANPFQFFNELSEADRDLIITAVGIVMVNAWFFSLALKKLGEWLKPAFHE